MSKLNSKVYIDLDSVLDTRAGTLKKIAPERMYEFITSRKYYQRDEDKFEGIDPEEFRRQYQARDRETLLGSSATRMCRELGRIMTDLSVDSHLGPLRGETELTVNTYPYQLTEDECREIEACLIYYTGEVAPVKTVYMPLESVTPKFLKNQYSLMIMHDYAEWLDLHANEILNNIQLPDVTLLIPKKWFKDKPTLEEIQKEGFSGEEDLFTSLELLSIAGIGLTVVDPNLWNTIPPEPIDESTPPHPESHQQ